MYMDVHFLMMPSVAVYGETEPAKCVEVVHVFCCIACAYPPRRAGVLNRIEICD